MDSYSVQDWLHGRAGAPLLAAERQLLNDYLPTLFGYHLIQVGEVFSVEDFSASPINHRVQLGLDCGVRATTGLLAQAEALPIANESVDLVVLPHVLEFSCSPHAILREADRVLFPDGHVLIFGFNPWSHWQLYRGAMRWRHPIPWGGRYVSRRRLKDWLQLLGFEVLQSTTFGHRWPHLSRLPRPQLPFVEEWGSRLLPHMGGAYCLLARKCTEILTPIRRPRLIRRNLLEVGLSKSTRCKI